MPKRPPLTVEQRAEIAHLREEKGWSAARIATKLNVSIGSVTWHCLMQGIEKAGFPGGIQKGRAPETYNYIRNGHQVRGWTKEDDKQLLKLEREGKNASEISRAIGRRYNSVRGRLATLARREERQNINA